MMKRIRGTDRDTRNDQGTTPDRGTGNNRSNRGDQGNRSSRHAHHLSDHTKSAMAGLCAFALLLTPALFACGVGTKSTSTQSPSQPQVIFSHPAPSDAPSGAPSGGSSAGASLSPSATQAAASASASSSQVTPQHYRTSRYQFDIPQYWQGRVTVTIDEDTATITSAKYPQYSIASISVEETEHVMGGDAGGSLMGKVPLPDGHTIVIWATRWTYIVSANAQNPSYAGEVGSENNPTPDAGAELIDLQTGGTLSYADAVAKGADPDSFESVAQTVDRYLQQHLIPSVQPL